MADESIRLTIEARERNRQAITNAKKAVEDFNKSVERLNKALAGDQKALAEIEEEYKRLTPRLREAKSQTENLTTSFIKANVIYDLLRKSIGWLNDQIRSSIDESMEMQRALVGLSSVSEAFGISQERARDAVISLTKDGLLTFQEAGEGLKNLIATGFDLDQAIGLMEAFKDAAAFNRQGTLEFGEAIVGATIGLKNHNAIMFDNVGIATRLGTIIRRMGYDMKDFDRIMADATLRQELYNQILQEAAVFKGDAARMTETLEGSMKRLNASVKMLKANIGMALAPALQILINALIGTVEKGRMSEQTLIRIAKAGVKVSSALREFALYVKKFFQGLWLGIKTTVEAIIEAINTLPQILTGKELIKWHPLKEGEWSAWWNDLLEQRNEIFEEKNEVLTKIEEEGLNYLIKVSDKTAVNISRNFDEMSKRAERAAERIKDILKSIEEENEEYEYSLQKARERFEESMRDLIVSHREKTESIKRDIEEEKEAYREALEDRIRRHKEWLEEEKKKHAEKVASIKEQIEKENKEFKERQKKIRILMLRQLSQEHEADETIIEMARKKLEEEKEAHTEKLRDLQEKLRKEVEEHKETIKKKEEDYQRDLKKIKDTYQERLDALKEELQKELDLQKKYADEFAKFKDAEAKDDIQRLKDKFEEEMKELERQHQKRLRRLREQLEEQKRILAEEGVSTTTTPSQPTSPTPPPTTGRDWIEYRVQPGDTLWGIAQRFLGNGARWTEIQGYTGNPRNLPVGTLLRIPKAQHGMFVPGIGPMPILAHGGETILTPKQTMGLLKLLEQIASKGVGGFQQTNNISEVNIYEPMDIDTFLRKLSFDFRTRGDL